MASLREGIEKAQFQTPPSTSILAVAAKFDLQPPISLLRLVLRLALLVEPETLYAHHVHNWRTIYGKNNAWETWMLNNRSRYEPVLFLAVVLPVPVVIAFKYDSAPIAYDPPWSSETEHMQALEKFMELMYPGYDFEFKFNGNTNTSYANVIAGIPTNDSHASGKNIYVYYEGILAHEFAHVMKLLHHYDTIDTVGTGQHMPPGETKCLFDRNAEQFCSACRAALLIPLDIDNLAAIMAARKVIDDRYPY
jgi:hypothetical protein